MLITDDRGPIGLAGTMGGLETEIGPDSTDLVIEAAHFLPVPIARMARRHKLPSEASRSVSSAASTPRSGPVASARAVALLTELGGATYVGTSEVDLPRERPEIALDPARPARTAGLPITADVVRSNLQQVGCTVVDAERRRVARDAADLAARSRATRRTSTRRSSGWSAMTPSRPSCRRHRPVAASPMRSGCGAASASRWLRRATSRRRPIPFVAEADLDSLLLPADDARRHAMRLANPLSDEEPLLRTTLLPGLLHALRRNIGRGSHDVGLFEVAPVFRPGAEPLPSAPSPPLDRRPTDDEVAALDAALPAQPTRVAVALSGHREMPGWWGPGRPAGWADAVEAAQDGRPRGAGGADGAVPTSTRRGTPAAARCCSSATGSSVTRASCTPGSSRPGGCPSGRPRWSST